jgi:hypothetical protein
MIYQPHPQMTIRRRTIMLRSFPSGPEYALGAAYRALTVWEAGAKPEVPRGERLLSARLLAQAHDSAENCTKLSVEITTGRWFRSSMDSASAYLKKAGL